MWAKLWAILFALALFALPCHAEAQSTDTVNKSFGEFMENIPDDIAKLLPDSFFDGGIDSAAQGLDEVLDTGFFAELMGTLLSDGLKTATPTLLSLFSVLLVSALLATFKDTLRSEALSGAVSLAVSTVMTAILVRCAAAHIEAVTGFLSRLSELCLAMLPILGAVLAMGGSGSAAVATHGGFLMLLGALEAIVGEAFGGIVGISLALSAANVFSSKFRLGAVARAIRRCFGVFFGAVMSLLSFILSIKIGIAAAGDSVAMRGAKMFASNAIPLVGSAIGDSFRTLATALTYIKGVSGAVGIILILLLALPTFLSVWLYRCGLVLVSGAAEMLGCDRERELLSGVVSVYGYMLAVIAISSVVFILMLTLFTKSTLAFGGGL